MNNQSTFLDKILLSNETRIATQSEPAKLKEILTTSFDSTFLTLKILFCILFLVMALVNKYITFIKEHPVTFTLETLIYGISGTLPFLYMEIMRKNKGSAINFNMLLIIFAIYLFFNITLEIGGFYKIFYDHGHEKTILDKIKDDITHINEERHKKVEHFKDTTHSKNNDTPTCIESENISIYNGMMESLFYTVILALVFEIIVMLYLTFKVYDFTIPNYESNTLSIYFIIEILLFGLCNSVPFMLVAYNRQKSNFKLMPNMKEVLLLFIKFVILHVLLQGSGFYNHMFK